MKFKGVGRALMAAGVVCMIIYILAALSGLTTTTIRMGGVLFYIGLVALIVGLVVRLSRSTPRT